MARNTALQNAILRTTRFDNILGFTKEESPKPIQAYSESTYSLLTDLTSSYYKVIIEHKHVDTDGNIIENFVSIIEILNKKIVSINAATSNEYFAIKDDTLYIKGISGILTLAVEYYDYFELLVNGIETDNGINFISSLIENYILTEDESKESEKIYYTLNLQSGEYEVDSNENFETDIKYYEKVIKPTTIHYTQEVHSQDVYVKELNVSTTKTYTLDCEEIRLGTWSILMNSPTEAIVTVRDN